MSRRPKLHVDFLVRRNPLPKQSTRFGKRGAWQPRRIREYQAHVRDMADTAMAGRGPIPTNIMVQVNIVLGRKDRRRVDVDNMTKPILDAMNGVVFMDDQQVLILHVEKQQGLREKAFAYVQVLILGTRAEAHKKQHLFNYVFEQIEHNEL